MNHRLKTKVKANITVEVALRKDEERRKIVKILYGFIGKKSVFNIKKPIKVNMIVRITFLVALLASLNLQLVGCSKNPTTGEKVFTGGFSETEAIRVGTENHPKIVEFFGGEYGSNKLKAYVHSIGQLMASTSERRNLKWCFTILNSDTVNAFAMPGGFVYITRGLLALADNEAQLASVLAHEIGHVTALHHARRHGQSLIAKVGILTAEILGGREIGRFTQFGTTTLLQSFSREKEFEADKLGIRYTARVGYKPTAMAQFLSKLRAHSQLTAQRQGKDSGTVDQFNYLSTHPTPLSRVYRAKTLANSVFVKNPMTGRDIYLSKIDGMLYGSDLEQGLIQDQSFVHPRLLITFRLPKGFSMFNTKRAVYAFGPAKSRIIFDRDSRNTKLSMQDYLAKVWGRSQTLNKLESIKVNALEAATGTSRITTRDGPIDIRLVAYRITNNEIYRFRFLTIPNQTAKQSIGFRRTTYSFRQLLPSEAKKLSPLQLQIDTVKKGDTVRNMALRMPYSDYQIERFRVLNGISSTKKLRLGQKVKIIVQK